MDHFLPYIPMDRRQALARGTDLPEHTRGSALFADISGFTPLTEALVRAYGPQRGAEELSRHLNRVYDALIAEIDRLHGSVVGFSGDAITCWFDGDDGLRASACGLALQQTMSGLGPSAILNEKQMTLAIKVAVANGPIRRFVVGDPQIQLIDVMAGMTLQYMAAAEHLATSGEVVVDESVLAGLGDDVQISERRTDEVTGRHYAVVDVLTRHIDADPWPDLPPDAVPEEMQRSWLLPAVYERLTSGQGEFLAELRPAVALFLRFTGIDYDNDPAAATTLGTYVRWVQHVVTKYGGNVIQLTVGDKGSYMYVAFGAPIAHDDAAVRAVAAALDLVTPSPADVSMRGRPAPQIGISRGRMRVGGYGGTTRTYGILGDEVNMAARLMMKADPGQIVIGSRVADVVTRHFHLQPLGTITVKGKSDPVAVSAVLGRRRDVVQTEARYAGTTLVGRQEEMECLSRALDDAIGGGGRIVRMEGNAGIGKSHLANALIERARERDVQVAIGISQSIAQDTAYAPWRQILRSLLNLDTTDSASTMVHDVGAEASLSLQIAALEELIRQTNPEWVLRLPLLGDLLGLTIPDNPTTAAFDARLRVTALAELVVEIVSHWAGRQPLLLILDDVHWMDEASLGLTTAVGRALAHIPVLMVLSQRPPAEDQALLPDLDLLPFHDHLNLNELTPAGVAALVANRLDGELTLLAAGLIFAESQGNPFFTEEMVDTLREAGDLVPQLDGRWWLSDRLFRVLQKAKCLIRRDGEWILSPDASLAAADLGLPDSIHNIVLSRLDRLPDQVKLTMKVASVVGATFTVDVLSQAHPARPSMDNLLAHLRILETRDFARLEGSHTPRYMFKHNVTREVAYETLLYTQRREMHRAVGQALEKIAPDETAPLAHHFFAAEEWTAAMRYQVLAGKQNQRLFANFDAIEHFNKALLSALNHTEGDTLREQQEIHAALGELLTTVSKYDTALEHLQAALNLARSLYDADSQAHACRWFARVHEQRGEFDLALDWIGRGQAALEGRETTDTAEALITAGLIHTRQGRYSAAMEQAKNALYIAEQLDATSLMARANGLLGMIAWKRGTSMQAIPDLHKALELYAQAANSYGEGLIHNIIAPIYFDQGAWVEADHHFRRAREIFHRIGDVYNRALTENNIGTIARYQGRLSEAEIFFKQAISSLDQLGSSPYHVALWEMNLGDVCLARGQVEEARQHFAISRENAAKAQSKALMPDLHRVAAEAALLAGELDVAAQEAQLSQSVAQELSMRGDEGHALRVLGQVAAARGEKDAAERYLQESVAVLREVHQDYGEALSQLALAQFYHDQGREVEIADALAICIPIFERLDAAPDLAKARVLQDTITGTEAAHSA